MKNHVAGLILMICGFAVTVVAVSPSLALASNYGIGTEIDMSYLINAGDSFVIADDGDYFGRIDLSTGYVNVIGVVDPPNGENLAIDPAGYAIYNVAGEKTATPLITINEATAVANIINSDIGLYDVDALSFNPVNGTLYAVKSDYHDSTHWIPGILYTIDKSTGDTAMVADLSFPSPDPLASAFDPHVDGMAFHPESGALYAAYSAWAYKSYLVTINTVSGDMVLVGGPPGDSGYTGVDDIEDISFAPDGTLYAVLGDQGALGNDASGSFEGLVTLDILTAQSTPVGKSGDSPGSSWDLEALAIAVPQKYVPPIDTPGPETSDIAVGIEVMQVDKANLILPWLTLIGLILLVIGIRLFIKRRSVC